MTHDDRALNAPVQAATSTSQRALASMRRDAIECAEWHDKIICGMDPAHDHQTWWWSMRLPVPLGADPDVGQAFDRAVAEFADYDQNPDGIVPGQDSGPRMDPHTGLWDVPDDEADPPLPVAPAEPFQPRVVPWLLACFGSLIAGDRQERNHRFLEEALELVQACGCSRSEAHQLVDYVYGRPAGERFQEAGGVMVTLAALCLAQGMDMHEAGETELTRIWTMVEAIRAKQAAKPKHSPLPTHPGPITMVAPEQEPDCAGGMPCTDCPDKRECQRGCIRQPEFVGSADRGRHHSAG